MEQSFRRSTPTPLVLDQCTTERLVRFVIDNHRSPTTLIICSTRDAFIQEFLTELHPLSNRRHHEPQDDHVMDPELESAQGQYPGSILSPLLTPTLNLLSAIRSIRVAFCPELTHLLAYLSKLSQSHLTSTAVSDRPDAPPHARPLLAILDPIRLHKPTSSFSAQGFNRTFAAAVDTAHRLGQQLIMAERITSNVMQSGPINLEVDLQDRNGEGSEGDDHTQRSASPWDEELSMLNVTTKTFGAGERGWVGRTVRIRQIAQRWCESVVLSDEHQADG